MSLDPCVLETPDGESWVIEPPGRDGMLEEEYVEEVTGYTNVILIDKEDGLVFEAVDGFFRDVPEGTVFQVVGEPRSDIARELARERSLPRGRLSPGDSGSRGSSLREESIESEGKELESRPTIDEVDIPDTVLLDANVVVDDLGPEAEEDPYMRRQGRRRSSRDSRPARLGSYSPEHDRSPSPAHRDRAGMPYDPNPADDGLYDMGTDSRYASRRRRSVRGYEEPDDDDSALSPRHAARRFSHRDRAYELDALDDGYGDLAPQQRREVSHDVRARAARERRRSGGRSIPRELDDTVEDRSGQRAMERSATDSGQTSPQAYQSKRGNRGDFDTARREVGAARGSSAPDVIPSSLHIPSFDELQARRGASHRSSEDLLAAAMEEEEEEEEEEDDDFSLFGDEQSLTDVRSPRDRGARRRSRLSSTGHGAASPRVGSSSPARVRSGSRASTDSHGSGVERKARPKRGQNLAKLAPAAKPSSVKIFQRKGSVRVPKKTVKRSTSLAELAPPLRQGSRASLLTNPSTSSRADGEPAHADSSGSEEEDEHEVPVRADLAVVAPAVPTEASKTAVRELRADDLMRVVSVIPALEGLLHDMRRKAGHTDRETAALRLQRAFRARRAQRGRRGPSPSAAHAPEAEAAPPSARESDVEAARPAAATHTRTSVGDALLDGGQNARAAEAALLDGDQNARPTKAAPLDRDQNARAAKGAPLDRDQNARAAKAAPFDGDQHARAAKAAPAPTRDAAPTASLGAVLLVQRAFRRALRRRRARAAHLAAWHARVSGLDPHEAATRIQRAFRGYLAAIASAQENPPAWGDWFAALHAIVRIQRSFRAKLEREGRYEDEPAAEADWDTAYIPYGNEDLLGESW